MSSCCPVVDNLQVKFIVIFLSSLWSSCYSVCGKLIIQFVIIFLYSLLSSCCPFFVFLLSRFCRVCCHLVVQFVFTLVSSLRSSSCTVCGNFSSCCPTFCFLVDQFFSHIVIFSLLSTSYSVFDHPHVQFLSSCPVFGHPHNPGNANKALLIVFILVLMSCNLSWHQSRV